VVSERTAGGSDEYGRGRSHLRLLAQSVGEALRRMLAAAQIVVHGLHVAWIEFITLLSKTRSDFATSF